MLRPQDGIQVDKFYPPTDWLDNNNQQIDIRKNAEDNTITLLYGVKSDFSKYALFGLLTNTSSGTYNVYIDDILYATTTKNTQTDIDFSTLGSEYVSIGTGIDPTDGETILNLHKIVIKPTTSGETLTLFRCAKNTNDPATTSRTAQGLMWYHLELTNVIDLTNCVSIYSNTSNSYYNPILYAVTCKGDILNFNSNPQHLVGIGSDHGSSGSKIMNYLPQLNTTSSTTSIGIQFGHSDKSEIKRIRYINKDTNFNIQYHAFRDDVNLEQICINNTKGISPNTNALLNAYLSTRKLKQTLNKLTNFSTVISMSEFLVDATNLLPQKIDVSNAINLTKITTHGSSTYPMLGFRGLKVSNEAPFTGSSPQINVSYTGLDRDALVELFESMPGYMKLDKVGEPTIDSNGVVSGFSSSDYLKRIMGGIFDDVKSIMFTVKINSVPTTITNNALVLGLTGLHNIRFYVNSSKNLTLSFYDVNNTQRYLSANAIKIGYYRFILEDGVNPKVYYSDDNITWNLLNSTSYKPNAMSITTLYIGYLSSTYNVYDGSIDLKNSDITINNARYQFQLPDDTTTREINITAATGNNITLTGNATIDGNGILSNLDASSSATINYIPTTYNSIEVLFKVSYPNGKTSSYIPICAFNVVNSQRRITTNGSSGTTLYWDNATPLITFSTTEFNVVNYFNNGFYVKFKCIKEINKYIYILSLSADKNTWVTKSVESTYEIFTNTLYLLRNASGSSSGIPQMFLEETYLKVDNNYIMKGYITDTDKNIALNKGWALTLS